MCEDCKTHTTGLLGEALRYVDQENWAGLNVVLIAQLAQDSLDDPYVRERYIHIADKLAAATAAPIMHLRKQNK